MSDATNLVSDYPKITFRLEPELRRQLKIVAATAAVTQESVIVAALEKELKRRAKK